jgi:hypothetical protein
MSLKNLFFRRKPIPSEVAGLMVESFVNDVDDFSETQFGELSAIQKATFREKTRLYKQAAVMLCIMACERNDKRFAGLRKNFENRIFPTARGEEFLESYLAAISDLEDLISPPEMKFYWARRWFSAIGVEITNPVRATLFVISWQQRIFHVREALLAVGKQA